VGGKGRNNPQRKGTRNFGTWTDSSSGLTPATRRLPAKGKPQDASHYTSQLLKDRLEVQKLGEMQP
jgi:hypothetical protein